ncbi:hypothetical protein BX666DRAFT_1842142, partial [Dichotomocladium elegans]
HTGSYAHWWKQQAEHRPKPRPQPSRAPLEFIFENRSRREGRSLNTVRDIEAI